jgi:hypothetical protein
MVNGEVLLYTKDIEIVDIHKGFVSIFSSRGIKSGNLTTPLKYKLIANVNTTLCICYYIVIHE